LRQPLPDLTQLPLGSACFSGDEVDPQKCNRFAGKLQIDVHKEIHAAFIPRFPAFLIAHRQDREYAGRR